MVNRSCRLRYSPEYKGLYFSLGPKDLCNRLPGPIRSSGGYKTRRELVSLTHRPSLEILQLSLTFYSIFNFIDEQLHLSRAIAITVPSLPLLAGSTGLYTGWRASSRPKVAVCMVPKVTPRHTSSEFIQQPTLCTQSYMLHCSLQFSFCRYSKPQFKNPKNCCVAIVLLLYPEVCPKFNLFQPKSILFNNDFIILEIFSACSMLF